MELADRLERMARECEDTEDSETGEMAVFVPRVVSGFFYDDLIEAARLIRARKKRARRPADVEADRNG